MTIAVIISCASLWLAPARTHAGAIWRGEVSEYREPLGTWRQWLLSKLVVRRPPIGTTFTVGSSAYTSSPYQTDSTPCITAAGTRVRPGVVASNFLPFGTILDIDGQYYIVEDRMSPRYNGQFVDIWFPSTSEALEFGRRKVQATIVDYGTPGQELTPVVSVGGKVEPLRPSVIERASLRFLALTRSIARVIPANVNRYDVNCFD